MKISIDVPSGLPSDPAGWFNPERDPAIRADITLSFEVPKLSFFFPQTGLFAGKWEVLPIGLNEEEKGKTESPFFLTDEAKIRSILKRRSTFGHKGDFGHALLIGGSFGKAGAITLAAEAALRSGAGLVSVATPEKCIPTVHFWIKEAMTIPGCGKKRIVSFPPDIQNFNAIGVGPGLGTHPETADGFIKFLSRVNVPICIDADALNIISEVKGETNAVLPRNSVLTPHPGEFKRLAGPWKNDMERLELQREFSGKNGVILILKGAHSSISLPDGSVHFNPNGNPGMATAGSGDVLTGIVTGLLARGYTPEEASILGCYIHGYAGDIASLQCSEEALVASDITRRIGRFFKNFPGLGADR